MRFLRSHGILHDVLSTLRAFASQAERTRPTRFPPVQRKSGRPSRARDTDPYEEEPMRSLQNLRGLRGFPAARPDGRCERGEEKSFQQDALMARETLKWHRKETHLSKMIDDLVIEKAPKVETGRWWDSWEAEWDDGWDWEEKWQRKRLDGTPASPSEVIVGKDDPRRPQGPMWQREDGSYQPVPTLNHYQLAEAIVAARNRKVDELHWQALCRRAELVAMSMTPAELLAVARCVGERQSGQLRLLWKIATFVVERISSYTTVDLVCLANVYSSLDVVHHGMLNVVALILASPEDERIMDAPLAVDTLKSFARAEYPLPLLVGEVKRILLSDCLDTLKPRLALSALESFSALNSLDGELLALLLPHALGPSSLGNLAPICAAASWAASQAQFEPIKASGMHRSEAEDSMNQVATHVTKPSMSINAAQEVILQALEACLQKCKLPNVQVVAQGKQTLQGLDIKSAPNAQGPLCPLCVVPTLQGPPVSVRGELLLGAAQLLAMSEQRRTLAAQLLKAAVGSSTKVALWQPEQLLPWLEVAMQSVTPATEVSTIEPEVVVLILRSICTQPARLTAISASLALALPRILQLYGEPVMPAISDTGQLLCDTVRPELYRLPLLDTYRLLEGCLKVEALLASEETTESRSGPAKLLFSAVLKSLPLKFKSEAIFHRKVHSTSGPELAEWCVLLAESDLEAVPESVWALLAAKSQEALAASGLGVEASSRPEVSGARVARQIFSALLKVRSRSGGVEEDI